MFELETALSQAHDTSPDRDGIKFNMLRHLNTTSLSRLLFLFIIISTEQKYLSQWHKSIVNPILKPGKDSSNPLNYRPIALTSYLSESVPQRSVLSVTLFIVHLSQILHLLPLSVLGNLYIDDLQISCQGSNTNLIERQLQNEVNKLVAWCNNNGHTISPEKSRCVHFCRKRNLHLDPAIHIQNIAIPVVDDIWFLGVIFDHKFTFLPHILHFRKRCERSLNILKVLSKTSWGNDRTSLLPI
ncbi:hypothetical protein AVEN_156581-1 [Araneus ventricosus]|uniref:Reverse transcriptase domain-containing protein n=1 Tax=Araneus ventricosus TaxID=182803 RepID=A0A4Y2EUE7_ARAVE|nr:hypothetical protein AVEN_156581-1 [Araneus ventricosus]